MKIYVGHSSGIDYEEMLYRPLENSDFADEHHLIFPHRGDVEKSKETVQKSADRMIAEVSEPSTGLGVELGWAESSPTPVLCVYRDSSGPSGPVKDVADSVKAYETEEELLDLAKKFAEELE